MARLLQLTGRAPRSHDVLTAALMRQLVESPALRAACPVPFDEARLRHGQDGDGVAALEELRANFRNVSAVLDCVGCEKCRLWGKLQFLGLGTALKVRVAAPTRLAPPRALTARLSHADLVFAGPRLRVP